MVTRIKHTINKLFVYINTLVSPMPKKRKNWQFDTKLVNDLSTDGDQNNLSPVKGSVIIYRLRGSGGFRGVSDGYLKN